MPGFTEGPQSSSLSPESQEPQVEQAPAPSQEEVLNEDNINAALIAQQERNEIQRSMAGELGETEETYIAGMRADELFSRLTPAEREEFSRRWQAKRDAGFGKDKAQ